MFVIFTYARTGSYFLVDMLNQIEGVKCYGELFKKNRIELPESIKRKVGMNAAERDRKPVSYLKSVFRNTSAQCMGFKLFPVHNNLIRTFTHGSESFKKIILVRNSFDVYISFERAKASGVWIDHGNNKTVPVRIRFDPTEFSKICKWHRSCYAGVDQIINEGSANFLKIDYESVVDLSAFQSICPFLGIKASSIKQLSPRIKKQKTETLKELVINYQEMKNYIFDFHPEYRRMVKNG